MNITFAAIAESLILYAVGFPESELSIKKDTSCHMSGLGRGPGNTYKVCTPDAPDTAAMWQRGPSGLRTKKNAVKSLPDAKYRLLVRVCLRQINLNACYGNSTTMTVLYIIGFSITLPAKTVWLNLCQ